MNEFISYILALANKINCPISYSITTNPVAETINLYITIDDCFNFQSTGDSVNIGQVVGDLRLQIDNFIKREYPAISISS